MIIEDGDLLWLRDAFPGLTYDPNAMLITGDLDFCARYDAASERLRIEGAARDSLVQSGERICDAFSVRIELETIADSALDWPAVYETGGRCASIAKAMGISVLDLHVSSSGSCCLGIQVDPGPHRLERFVDELVVPFFYRVAYAERFGIARVRQDLWDEYRHGADGLRDRLQEISSTRAGRNSRCPCGSGRKYKVCCLRATEDRLRSLRSRLTAMSDDSDDSPTGGSRAARRRRRSRR